MKNKKYVIYNFLILIVLLIIVLLLIKNIDSKKNNDELYIAQEKVTDECIEEVDELDTENDVTASSAEVKLSPNASLVILKHYNECGHTVNEYVEILPEMVNKNQEEIEREYNNFTIQSFANNKLIIEKEEKGFCGEHYVLREENRIINSKFDK